MIIDTTIAIGIDPGATTGVAVWDIHNKNFISVGSMGFWDTIEFLETWEYKQKAGFVKFRTVEIVVVIENPDANKPTFRKAGRTFYEKISQDVGKNKRDGQLIIQWCERHGIKFNAITPGKNSGSKVDSPDFKKYTGWQKQTNQHARDAAMLVFKYKPLPVPMETRKTQGIGTCKNCGYGIDRHRKSKSTGFHFGELVCSATNMKTLGKTLYEPKHELPWQSGK